MGFFCFLSLHFVGVRLLFLLGNCAVILHNLVIVIFAGRWFTCCHFNQSLLRWSQEIAIIFSDVTHSLLLINLACLFFTGRLSQSGLVLGLFQLTKEEVCLASRHLAQLVQHWILLDLQSLSFRSWLHDLGWRNFIHFAKACSQTYLILDLIAKILISEIDDY